MKLGQFLWSVLVIGITAYLILALLEYIFTPARLLPPDTIPLWVFDLMDVTPTPEAR